VTRLVAPREACVIPSGAAYALVAFLMLAYTAGYAFSASHTDTADELMRAYSIRHGLGYPLEGPFLGNAIHLGPAWFYLVALPLWLSSSWLAAALFIGFVASLKFPLAYHCGRRLVDSDFGALWAACMFVPGFASLEPLLFLNPNAVAAAALLVLALALRIIDRPSSAGVWLAFGVALALAIHVHPTSVPAFVLLVPTAVAARRRGEAWPARALAFACGLVLPFVPYLASQVANGFADFGSASAYVSGRVSVRNIVHAPAIVFDVVVAGPRIVARYLLGWSEGWASALAFVALAACALSLVALADPRTRRAFALFAASLALFAAWVTCMRETTPFQFTWILGPAIAAVVALGVWSLSRRSAWRWSALAVLAVVVPLDTYAIARTARTVVDGEGVLPSRVLDVAGRIPAIEFHDVWFPAIGHARLGRLLCRPEPLSLHGHLAYVVDKDLALDTLFACGERAQLSLVGSTGTHYAGMTRRFWAALGRAPSCVIGSLGITRRATPLVARDAIAVAAGSRYLPRIAARTAAIEERIDVVAPADAAVLVTNVLGEYERFRIVAAFAEGRPVAPRALNDLSALYAAPGGNGGRGVAWTFIVATTRVAAVDVIAIPPGDDPGGRDCARFRAPQTADQPAPGVLGAAMLPANPG
jgi:hypothetical protein